MLSDQLLLGVAIGSLLYAATVLLAAGRRWTATTAGHQEQLIDHGENVVVCPDCAARNELGYRFCRSCVGELPGSKRFQRGSATPRSRLIR